MLLSGTSRRTKALVTLTVQNASIALLTRASRLGDTADGLYLPSVAVLAAEVLKAIFSLMVLSREYRQTARSKRDGPISWSTSITRPLHEAFVTRRKDLLVLLVPSILYAGQNNLLYVALSNLPASVYQTTYQLKLLSSALFSVLFFGRTYSLAKWFSLFLLTAGVAIVQLPSNDSRSVKGPTDGNPTLGFLSIFVACISSGIAGCYFEAILKPNTARSASKKADPLPAPSLALRNLQLAVVSLPFSTLGVLGPQYDRERVLQQGIFHGFGALGAFVVLNQALGGLLIAAVVKEADSVSKGFATSLAVILSTAISSFITHSLPNMQFVVGAFLVVLATTMFASVI